MEEKTHTTVESSLGDLSPDTGHAEKLSKDHVISKRDEQANKELTAPIPSTPPSFAQSEFQTIVRRQHHADGPKIRHHLSRSPHLSNEWEFAGWGSMRYLDITPVDLHAAEESLNHPVKSLNEIRATSVSGNGVTGSVFYAFPVVAAVAGIYSPLCLVVATFLLLFFRPVMLELANAVHLNGANYVYLLQASGKFLAIIGAAGTLLDAIATSAVSAATASTYLAGEFAHLPISTGVLAILFLIALGLFALAGLRESTTVTASVFLFHLFSMAMLAIACVVHWARADATSAVLRANWALRPVGALETVRAIFYGTCVAFLGVTGFECTPSYIEHMSTKTYAAALRNLVAIAVALNGVLSLMVYAILSTETIASGANILSVLAEVAAGRWLRIVVVVDAVGVLLGGVLTGVLTADGLIGRLTRDRVLPQVFVSELPITGSTWLATLFSLLLALLLFLASGMNLATVSSMFSISFLFVLFLFTISDILLKINRPHLPRQPSANTMVLLGAFTVVCVTLAGNIARDPTAIGLFAAFFFVVLIMFFVLDSQPYLVRLALRIHSTSGLERWACTRKWKQMLVRWYQHTRDASVCVWIKHDDIHMMLQTLLSVQANTPHASKVVFVHAYRSADRIPNELHPNSRLLDEAFPTITVDLVFVLGVFNPVLVEAVSRELNIPRSRMCIVTLGPKHPWALAEYGGVRIIK